MVLTDRGQVTVEQLDYAARLAVQGPFFTVDLDDGVKGPSRSALVRKAEVRRRWPDGIECAWNTRRWPVWTVSEAATCASVGCQGEVFVRRCQRRRCRCSRRGSAGWLPARHAEFSGKLGPLGVRWSAALSAREAWQLKLDNG